MEETIIGVDLGGTRVRAARLDQRLNIQERREELTLAHEGLDATLGRIKSLIRQVMPDDGNVTGIGVSAPGPLNPETGVVVAPPNLPGWHDVPLGDILKEEFGVPVYVGNDANVACLAEATLGEARGASHAIYITVSTGIGSGIVSHGHLILGKSGLGAEAGHMIMVVEGDRISTLEKEAAGPALARQARARIKAGEPSKLRELCEGDLEKIDARLVGVAAVDGDELALSIIQRAGRMVGLGIVTILHLFNPEIVVIGGGVSNIGEPLFEPLRAAVREYTIDDDYWKDLRIVRSRLNEDVSIFGAAVLVVTKGGTRDIRQVVEKLGHEMI